MSEDSATIALYRALLPGLHDIATFSQSDLADSIDLRTGKPKIEALVEKLYDDLEPLGEAVKGGRTTRSSPLYQALDDLLGGLLPAALRSRSEFLERSRECSWLDRSVTAKALDCFKRRLGLAEEAEELAQRRAAELAQKGLPQEPNTIKAYRAIHDFLARDTGGRCPGAVYDPSETLPPRPKGSVGYGTQLLKVLAPLRGKDDSSGLHLTLEQLLGGPLLAAALCGDLQTFLEIGIWGHIEYEDWEPTEKQRNLRALAILLDEAEARVARTPIASDNQPAALPGPARISGTMDPGDAGNIFRKEGDFWLIRFGEKEVRVAGAKGFEYIARLLRSPHEPVSAVDLAGRVKEIPTEAIDQEAVSRYRKEIEDLDGLIEGKAEDPSARAGLEERRASVEETLNSALGLHGQVRSISDAAEKARKSVSKCIREALDRLKSGHDLLWRHLDESIRTGTTCSYSPKTHNEWNV